MFLAIAKRGSFFLTQFFLVCVFLLWNLDCWYSNYYRKCILIPAIFVERERESSFNYLSWHHSIILYLHPALSLPYSYPLLCTVQEGIVADPTLPPSVNSLSPAPFPFVFFSCPFPLLLYLPKPRSWFGLRYLSIILYYLFLVYISNFRPSRAS